MEVRKITENRFEKRETLALFTQRAAFKIHSKSIDIKDRNGFIFVAGFSLLNKHSLDELSNYQPMSDTFSISLSEQGLTY